MKTLLKISTLIFFVGLSLCIDPPVYSKAYRATGHINLPYAEIDEPFTAFFDVPNSRSRVDYYNGIQSTIQISKSDAFPNGVSYKIVPVSTQDYLNKVTCFQINGTSADPIDLTTIIPDLTDFKFVSETSLDNVKVNMFQMVHVEESRTNTYTFWSSADSDYPMKYEMMGYDSLLGSHYDKYFVEYDTWVAPAEFDDADFAPPAGMQCGDFPGPGFSKHRGVELDPIREFVHSYDAHVDDQFESFKEKHGKSYDQEEHEPRKHIFRQNLRYINSVNRQGLSYRVGVNHLTDMSKEERQHMRGFRYTHGDHGGKKFTSNTLSVSDAPDQWDWRLLGAVNPVKDQAICGSCWSFGTTGTIEGANFLKTGKLVRLSEQELVDCSWAFGNNGCDGGEDFRAYQYMLTNGGLATEDVYSPYYGIDGVCKRDKVKPVVALSNYTVLPAGDLSTLKLAIYEKGPISVAIDASQPSFSFYVNGVYYDAKCKNGPDDLDHAVLAVGYGTLNGEDYWLVKNSWSTYWGNDGYVLMSQKDNNCGVATDATFVEIA